MENKVKIYNRIGLVTVFVALPILVYLLGEFPRRSILKELLSVVTFLAFFIMLLQFYLSRANKALLNDHKMSKVIKWHKLLGYIFVSILVLHPFFIILPRYFEAGIHPNDAINLLISNFSNSSLFLGLLAWILMIILALSSIFRTRLGLSYKSWRLYHGVLSSVFIVIAALHALNLGRHMNIAMSTLIIILASGAIVLLLKTYLFNSNKVLRS